MGPVERCYRAIEGGKPGRVPVVPLIISHSTRIARVPFCKYNTDPQVIADCQIAAWRRYGYDGFHISSDNWVLPEAMGVEVRFYEDQPPVGVSRPLGESKDLSRLPSVNEARGAARMGMLPAATRIARKQIGDSAFIKTNFDQGPFSLCTALRGIDRFMLDLRDDEPFAFKLLEICSQIVFELGAAVAAAGAHAITFGDSTAGLLGRADFEKFALPFEKEVIGRLKQAAAGVPVFLHICGRTSHIVDLMAASGADALELDHFNDLAATRRRIGGLCLEGNLDPVGVMRNSSAHAVCTAARALIEELEGAGLILSPGCELPPDTPSENIDALVRAAIG